MSWEDIGPWMETDNPHRVKVTAQAPNLTELVVELNWNAILYALTTFVNGSDPKYWTEDAYRALRSLAQNIEDEIDMCKEESDG